MGTSSYDEKRSFASTPEPPAGHSAEDVDPLSAPAGDSFVIQQHHATALHHDLRLEMLNNQTPVLVSWAVPKGLPRRRGERHLAIRTEDHPMAYATFSGSIPEEEYGGGEVRIFDHGNYELVDRSDDRLTFRLAGERLAGVWHLVHTGTKDGKDQWLAIMSEDLRPAGDDPPPFDPMLASRGEGPFDDPDWIFEPRWAGVRALAVCGEDTRIVSVPGPEDVTADYPELHRLHDRVVALDAILDGEIVAFDDGVPSGQALQQRVSATEGQPAEQTVRAFPVAYMVFDVLFVDGNDLTGEPWERRREVLEELIVPSETLQLSPVTERD
ncbi:MAG TPA: DNA polymerase ligase N-terminal domain-containing protein, partial [Acidimicrobiia bacterium]|nr:DNA polymerase ligase N-terminal domain-containing protein [Acidimicrobiia bacterium]